MHKIVCLKCNREFETQDKRRKFCSLKCRLLYQHEVAISKRIYKKCLNCNKEFYSRDKRKKFCGSSCCARYYNPLRGEKTQQEKQKISESLKRYHSLNAMTDETKEKISFSLFKHHEVKPIVKKEMALKKCKECNNDFMPDKSSRSYCSYECYNKSRNGKNKNEIATRTFIKILKRAFPTWHCPFCDWTHTFNIHHINGRKDNSFNSLVMLCPNHHSLAHLGKLSVEDMKKYSIGSTVSKEDLLKFYNGKNETFNINFHKYKMSKKSKFEMLSDRKIIRLG